MSNIPVKDVTPKTESMYAKREKIYVREIIGFFQKLRTYSLWALMLGYYGTVWINWGGRQAVYFDLPARQFNIFGVTFWPQDFILLSFALIIAAFGLFTITNLAGRVWCGYTCPQSAWSFLFMWIEERVEGSRNQRIKMDKGNMSPSTMRKKALKHTLWLFVALATGVTFVGYFSPIRELIPDMLSADLNGWEIFWIAFFTLATYINAGWMREQVCIYMCPYARFQSVMYDADTLAVSYDLNRGEPRGKRTKKAKQETDTSQLGDCVDCSLCVQVCPTGIDIRDGLQYQCIGCALCIDACDSIMDKLNKPKGLIRYTTENELEGQKTHLMRPRLLGYAFMLLVMMGAFVYAIASRVPFELDIARDRGSLYRVTPNDTVTNSYTLKMMNMSQQPRTYLLKVEGLPNATMDAPDTYNIRVNELREISVNLEIDPAIAKLPSSKTNIEFIVVDQQSGEEVAREESRFIAPRT
ncbi:MULTISPECIES: cytochrome c oxidase accessory protein CcoG [unclassified Oceanobacter]|uniref:cytochrome c oxidase accessory protein CcoG n=1 Tax=unclassified Oceanobacter TaxID=2620260 RepID=UPI0026E1E987|nr:MULTISPECIES: cytochrome c oxidase accessory protein CcoG [unclassified Oceanobacter]MDO6683226.1 cytochrome c oxidase accessory protein CcoG [Oceanobacter sp. 5_MG-2023]MDP2607408.1 cytochrome c oxidase accessory protein CcoG [Oceanobacter sp. 1_MG-2023]MDP2610676.1 cytochrome c oxidase accessory protein CcoG [Oceanobacter sp. 2_MG-2023]